MSERKHPDHEIGYTVPELADDEPMTANLTGLVVLLAAYLPEPRPPHLRVTLQWDGDALPKGTVLP